MRKIILVLAGLCFIAGCGKNSDRVDWDVKAVGDTNKPLYIRSAAEQLPVEIKTQTDTVLPVEMKVNKEVINNSRYCGSVGDLHFSDSGF
jgi:hypothetical protein